jgi:hypothetical protein
MGRIGGVRPSFAQSRYAGKWMLVNEDGLASVATHIAEGDTFLVGIRGGTET